MPIETKIYEFVSEQEVKYKTQSIYDSLWREKKRSEALEKMLEIYTSIVENEYQVSDELATLFMRNVLLYLRLFLEVLLFELDQQEDLKVVDDLSKTLILAHDNYDLRALYWETYFFSDKFVHQKYADELFQENPQLPRHLNFDHLVKKSQKYLRENYFRKLLEISLQFDLGDYEKSLTFESLVVFYCKSIY